MAILGAARSFHKKFAYTVEIQGVAYAGFTKVSELSAEVAESQYHEGGRIIPHKSPGRLTVADITLLFIAPENLRRGLGRALYEKAVDLARQLGVRELLIDSDPQAAAFYATMGATRIGAEPTGYQGRLLPKFSVEIDSSLKMK